MSAAGRLATSICSYLFGLAACILLVGAEPCCCAPSPTVREKVIVAGDIWIVVLDCFMMVGIKPCCCALPYCALPSITHTQVREKAIADQFEARRAKNKASRERKLARREERLTSVSYCLVSVLFCVSAAVMVDGANAG